jgi:hypothetical protein
MNFAALVISLALSTIVLRSGDRIVAEGDIREDRGVVIFRSNGALYSIRTEEIEKILPGTESNQSEPEEEVRRLRTDPETTRKLIAGIEQNRSAPPIPLPAVLERPPAPPTQAEVEQQKRDENEWRRQARAHEEAILRAREELALLEQEIAALEREIQTLFALGYKPRQFTHETTRLERLRERLPRARLEIERAERAWANFREDARRQGILPGWLR